ncbi:hypothetical protein PRIPAC_91850 [Pristionchus pacificus]|uniref:Yippee domain-containing protein n=1 Tax=Pristionchus pacificus TaxID=54126 RepID=A0A2A6BPV6_PRIPA|nr:hypothetical protein PRIPAC_91850 [Pristionchus pacificus]|eukprot:PDM67898.1 hypothetical protein PRIPAC_45942 [Pristionchus pacificus]
MPFLLTDPEQLHFVCCVLMSIVKAILSVLNGRNRSNAMRVEKAQLDKEKKTFQTYLDTSDRTYSCAHCRANLANHDQLISKSFQGSQGKAYLFNSVVNVGCGPSEERVLLTGQHTVADIYCDCCKTTLGWKYEYAYELSQKYKEGKFIIELAHMVKDNGWEKEDAGRKRRSLS